MARYTDESVRAVKDAVDMVDLVGTRSSLRKVNPDSYTGLCPFHDERTPSFSIKPSEKLYFCFGCQASGDAIRFAQETESLDFIGAVEFLADRYGVTLEPAAEAPGEAERRRRRERLHELLDRTCAYFERVLWESSEGAAARAYLAGRGLEEAVLREFRVGYAPSGWARVVDGSRRSGFTDAELLATDIVQQSTERPGSVYARFRRRITFPLCDHRGRVLGFGGRAMGEAQGPKYLNSHDGEIYHKGRHLFGTHLARAHAARAGAAVLCEGYTDVIAAHQAGVRNCVGLMGTALTEEQVGELGRLAPTVVLALDADGAGFGAMLKAAERVAVSKRVEVRVAALPTDSDPADVLEKQGPEAVRSLLGDSVPFVRFRVERILAAGDRESGEGRDRILDQLREVFGALALGPGAMREELEREIASRLSVSEKLVEQLLAGRGGTVASAADPAARGTPGLAAGERTERAFLELCIALPARGRELLAELDIDSVFGSPLARAAAAHLRSHLEAPAAEAGDGALAALLAQLAVRAAALAPVPAELEVERRQLELARVERAIAGARGVDAARLSALVREREAVKSEIGTWLQRALEDTAAPRD
jgi:DNA primase